MTTYAHVKLDHDGPVALLTISRPDALNALNERVLDELAGAIEEVAGTDGARCLVVTGEGKAFVAGADIEAMRAMGEDGALAFSKKGQGVLDRLESLPCPVIAAVNGFALGGGCELALACDFIYASEKAKLGQPEVKLGVIPGFGGTQRLARRVGVAMARELIYTGGMIDAAEAMRIGLVNRVFPPDELLPAARRTAHAIAKVGPLAVASAKRALLEGEERLLGEANARESELFAGCFTSNDQKEGMAAFVEKRDAAFTGS